MEQQGSLSHFNFSTGHFNFCYEICMYSYMLFLSETVVPSASCHGSYTTEF